MTDMWIVIDEDHRSDDGPFPFSSEERAVACARKLAGDMTLPGDVDPGHCEYIPGEQELNDDLRADGWVLWLVYSINGDSVRVVKRTMDDAGRLR
jgi:hypothetical protein